MQPITQLADFREPLMQARHAGHRLMLVLAVSEARGIELAQQLTQMQAPCLCIDVLKTHQSQLSDHQHINASQVKQYLGMSNQWVVYNAHRSFNASALCAASGTIIGGGVLILLTPPCVEWHCHFDAQLQAYGQSKAEAHSYFIQWWQQQWHYQPAVYTFSEPKDSEPKNLLPAQAPEALWQDLPQLVKQAHAMLPSAAQQILIQQLLMAYQQQLKQVFAINAPRGRGKSACLGWLIKAVGHDAPHGPVLVTAPSKRALGTMVQTAGAVPINFYALDRLLSERPKAGMLMVDEAAAIPLAQLTKLIKYYPLLVLSSTQDGYEGSGQGYRLKLPRIINKLGASHQVSTLIEPMRWQSNDPLEALVRKSFLCDAELPKVPHFTSTDLELALNYSYSQVTGKLLSKNTNLLRQVYALLMLAHYQTTPQDLRLLLDHPTQKIFLCHAGDCLIGLAWVAQEGNLDASLAHQIALGKRRVQGHLLAQILAQQAGYSSACVMGSWRIQRLVVSPALQNRGIGSLLLQEVCHWAQVTQVDFVGASFAASTEILRFWQANQFLVTWLGLRPDTATGLNSVQLIRPISSRAQALNQQLRCHFHNYLSFGKHLWFASVDAETWQLIVPSKAHSLAHELEAEDQQRLLTLLAQGQAGFCGALYILYQHLQHEADKQLVLQAAQSKTHKGLQKAVRLLALSVLPLSVEQ